MRTYTQAIGDLSLEVEYGYYEDLGSWEQPPHIQVEIISMFYNGNDVTTLLNEVASEYVEELQETIEDEEKNK